MTQMTRLASRIRIGFRSPLQLMFTNLSQETMQELESRRLQDLAPYYYYRRRLGLSPDGNATLNQGMYCPEFILRRSSGLSPPSRPYRPLPVSKTFIKRSSRSAGLRRGSRCVAIRLVFASESLTSNTSRRGRPRNQPYFDYCRTEFSNEGLRLEGNYKDHLGVASRFVQSIHKKLPDCINTDTVRMAFSIAKVIIEIKNVGCCLRILEHRLTINYIRWLETTKTSLQRNGKLTPGCGEDDISGVPKAAEEAMENLKSYVVFRALKEYHKEHVTIQDPWERNEVIEGPCR